uniref:Myb-like domain-containing protein n=1 Tax=Quercus lobata TaxID=97700 RepID=A0A7N2N727_QUELO
MSFWVQVRLEILAARVCRIKQRAQKKPFPQNDDSPRKLSSQENSTTEKKVTSKNKKHAASKKSRQPQVSTKQLTTMPFPTAKRKRLLWTAEEENMLKEGVHHVSASAKKNVPWRKILELGRHIFHKSRTPEDLKDKWRTMLAKEP